jgi:hypothetical protein
MSQKSKSHITREDETRRENDVDVKDSVVAVDVIPDSQQNTEHPTRPNTSNNKRNKEACLDSSTEVFDATTAPPKPVKRPKKYKPAEADEIRRIAEQCGFESISDLQIQWLVEYLNSEPDITDREISRNCGVHATTAGRWWRKQKWVDLVYQVSVSRERKHLGVVWRAARLKAEAGDIRAITLYTARFDPEFIALKSKVPGQSAEDKAKVAKAQAAIKAAASNKANGSTLPMTGTGIGNK